MNIDNVALVRATNIIPFDGIIKPVSNVPYLIKESGTAFSYELCDYLKEIGIIPKMDYTKISEENYEEYYNENVSARSKILKEYLPYISDYNSMVLFSINGLCPDDKEHGFGNNTFSNKKCAIIEPLSYHLDQTVSLVFTDTALKGNVTLSDKAIIMIEKETYMSLTDEEKLSLSNLNIKIFEGDLKENVKETLRENGYLAEDLSLSASTGGVIESETSEMLKNFIDQIRENYGFSHLKYFNLITTTDVTTPKYDVISDEYNKMLKVNRYFCIKFMKTLLYKLNEKEDVINNITVFDLDNREFIRRVIDKIKVVGIDKYKIILDEYNQTLKEQQKNGTLITPEEVVSGINSKTK